MTDGDTPAGILRPNGFPFVRQQRTFLLFGLFPVLSCETFPKPSLWAWGASALWHGYPQNCDSLLWPRLVVAAFPLDYLYYPHLYILKKDRKEKKNKLTGTLFLPSPTTQAGRTASFLSDWAGDIPDVCLPVPFTPTALPDYIYQTGTLSLVIHSWDWISALCCL